jgi:hypothetical protein
MAAVSWSLSTALQTAVLWCGGSGSTSLVCGPYGLLFALLVQYVPPSIGSGWFRVEEI